MQPDPRPGWATHSRIAGTVKRLADGQRLPMRRLQPPNGGERREGEAQHQHQESERAPDDQAVASHGVSARQEAS